MTERELSYKTNKELGELLDRSTHNVEHGIADFIVDDDMRDLILEHVKLYKEISKRLKVQPYTNIEDESF